MFNESFGEQPLCVSFFVCACLFLVEMCIVPKYSPDDSNVEMSLIQGGKNMQAVT